MAAIDPSEDPDAVDIDASTMTQRSTLKLVRAADDMFEEDDSDDEDFDEDDDEDDEEVNGGPSDLKKSNKAKKQALLEALAADEDEDMDDDEDEDEDDDDDDEVDDETLKKLIAATNKGKGKAVDGEDDDDDSSIDSDEALGLTEMAICTLDTKQVRDLSFFATEPRLISSSTSSSLST
jgi:FK506-binding nuclear protein